MNQTRLNELLQSAGMQELSLEIAGKFQTYLDLLVRWNGRVNLTSIRDREGILSRHFVESIACARALPDGIRTLLDFGSGAGFPGIPIALCRPEIAVTLAESQSKKAAFLREALRMVPCRATVFPGRAENLGLTFDCVTLRAVDRMEGAVRSASSLVSPEGWLGLMVTRREIGGVQRAAGELFDWVPPISLPNLAEGIIFLGRRRR